MNVNFVSLDRLFVAITSERNFYPLLPKVLITRLNNLNKLKSGSSWSIQDNIRSL